MINTIKVNGECMKCLHYQVCRNGEKKQNIISILRKELDIDIKPFELLLKCPEYISNNILTGSGGINR